jgi:hypothetical protein
MRQPDIDDLVRLTHDVPNLYLHRGEVGVVRSKWFGPTACFEVEFGAPGLDSKVRAVLLAEQLQLEENSAPIA